MQQAKDIAEHYYGNTAVGALLRMALQKYQEKTPTRRDRIFSKFSQQVTELRVPSPTTVLLSAEQKQQLVSLAKRYRCSQAQLLRVVLAWYIALPFHNGTTNLEKVATQ